MRKLLIFGLILLLVVGLAVSGCKAQQVVKPIKKTNASGTAVQTGGTAENQPVNVSQPASVKTNADLELKSVYWATIYPEKGSPVELKLFINNIGTETILGFDYSIKIIKDGVTWKDETFTYDQELMPSNSTKIIKKYTFSDTGKYKAEVYLDKDNKLGERKRLNNVLISAESNVLAPQQAAGTGSPASGSSSSGSCSDSDDGADEYTKGECDDGVSVFGISDYCRNSATLVEFSCGTDDLCHTEDIECGDGCESGACN